MNCRQFNKQVSDFAGGRLSSDMAARMSAHRDSCPACAQLDSDERSLRSAWSAMPEPQLEVSLWPRIALQLETPPAPARRPIFRPIFAYAGTLVVGAAAAFMLFRGPAVQVNPYTSQPGDDKVLVRAVNQLHTSTDPDRDVAAEASQDFGQMQRLILIGGVER
jgi:anti-sigma factor RsiW